MPSAEPEIPGLPSPDERLLLAMAAFQRLQNDYAVGKLENFPTTQEVAASFHLIGYTTTRRTKGQTEALNVAHTHRQRVTIQEKAAWFTWTRQTQL